MPDALRHGTLEMQIITKHLELNVYCLNTRETLLKKETYSHY